MSAAKKLDVKKAWIGHNEDGNAEIVWASTRGEARSKLAGALERDFFEVQDLRRYPALDGGVPDGMSLRQWQLQNGWWWECQQCSCMCYGREEGQSDEDGPFAFLDEDEHVFCSVKCQEKFRYYWAQHRALDEEVKREFAAQYPGVVLIHAWHNDAGGFAVAGEPLNQHVTLWEVVTVKRSRYP